MSGNAKLNGHVYATRDMFKRPVRRVIKAYPAPELGEGVMVCLRQMTPEEKIAFDRRGFSYSPATDTQRSNREFWDNLQINFLIEVVCDEQGTRILNEEDGDDLRRNHPALVTRLFFEGRKLSGYGTLDELRADVKNYEPIQIGNSLSPSLS